MMMKCCCIAAPLALMACAGPVALSPAEAQDDAANAAASPITLGGEGTPIAIPFSNNDPDFGAEINAYLQEAVAKARLLNVRTYHLYGLDVKRVTYQPVPNRRFAGLTVIGVESHWEGAAIIFKEPLPQVMAAFRANGLNIADDGDVPNNDGGYCRFEGDKGGEYGSALYCGH